MLDPDTRRRRDAAIAESARTGEPWEIEAEIHGPDGATRWMVWRGVSDVDHEGRPVAMLGTAMDITARKHAELVLRESSEELERRVAVRTAELEAANEELRAFSYSVSHDLRAPVRAIAGFARLLEMRNGDQLDVDGLHKLHNIVEAGEQMGRVIDDLLAYSRIGRAAIEPRPVQLEPIVDHVRLASAALLAESGGSIEVVAPLAAPRGDPTLLGAILLNLVTNALTYARAGVPPRVTVSATQHGESVVVAVSDNGLGMAADALVRIFEPFVRLATDDEHPGTGIGLAIVRRSARLLGGDVTVVSEPGAGSTFNVVLPTG
jgi:signal transduction histidine kinase